MKIRKATIEDVSGLSSMFDSYRVFYKKPADPEGARNFLEDRIRKADSEIFIAEDHEHTMMGFVQLYPLFSSTRMKRSWLLNDLFVRPEYRGLGVSKGLVDECKNLCRVSGSCGMILETAKTNIIGNSLYQKTGFVADTDHNYYEW